MPARNAVPHHRVDAALHTKARRMSEVEGISLSAIASAGLKEYTQGFTHNPQTTAKPTRRSTDLPEETVTNLKRLAETDQEQLASYLHALHNVGWSYGALAAPLKLSRQAIHVRLSKYPSVSTSKIPPVPVGPPRNRPTERGERFDWAIWINKNLYNLATENATKNGHALHEVMEQILTKYINGSLTVEKDVNTDKDNVQQREVKRP